LGGQLRPGSRFPVPGSRFSVPGSRSPFPVSPLQERSTARLEILICALLFSTGGAAIKSAAFTSWQVAGLRSGIAALAVWLLLPISRRVPRGTWGVTLLVAVAYAATLMLFVLANKLTTAANTIFLQSTAPVYILLLSPWLLHEKIKRDDVAVLVAVAAGMALFFVGRQATYATAPDPVSGNILAAFSGITYALMLVGLRYMGTRGGQPAAAVAIGNLFAFLAALPMLLPLGSHGMGDWAIVSYLGIFQIGVAYALLTRAVPQVPALEMSLLLFLEPALNPVWAWVFHGEVPGRWAIAGGLLIMSATLYRTLRGTSVPASA
jgi:drug/metabolite transporter (DMT)-like permease